MPFYTRAIAAVLACAPTAALADCVGFLNQSEQGYKLEGDRLEPSGPNVTAGTELEFKGLTKVRTNTT